MIRSAVQLGWRRRVVRLWVTCVWGVAVVWGCAEAVAATPEPSTWRVPGIAGSRLLEVAGTVEVRMGTNVVWVAARTGTELAVGDAVRTGSKSRAALLFSDRSVLRLSERTTLRIQPPRDVEKRRFSLIEGLLFFFNRERPADIEFETPLATGAIRGTEFVLGSGGVDGVTRLTLLDGRVSMMASGQSLTVERGEQAWVEPGQPPRKSPLLDAVGAIQWALYYPAVVVPVDLGLTEDERKVFGSSLEAYDAGDLMAAHRMAEEAAGVAWGDNGKLYRAALELAVGRVDRAEEWMAGVTPEVPVARALRELIAVVRGEAGKEEWETLREGETASEWLARSYKLQARYRLDQALAAAERALERAPNSGYAWVRVAELKMGMERGREALSDLTQAMKRSPRLAQAWVLRGFLLLEGGETEQALGAFRSALDLDAALGSAWLGRGLAEMRLRRDEEALVSLQAAAALDPRRAVYRAYLGKAFHQHGETKLAEKEFRLARELDPMDPTGWFYSALHAWMENRPNTAVREMEQSVERNDQRQVFRSRFGLDRDLAVRHANLAGLYRDAGLPEVSLRSAAAAVMDDYANFSAHLFLANSYQALEDPNRFDLRYETVRQSELLMANLLAPAGGANLSQLDSQQERLQYFDARALGFSSWTVYRSSGDWRQEASGFGTVGGLSYALDAVYNRVNGPGNHDDGDRTDVSLQVKQTVTGSDAFYAQVSFMDATSEDLARHERLEDTDPTLAVEEQQVPNVALGWHHAWSPASHTLLLFARLSDAFVLRDGQPSVLFFRQAGGVVTEVSTPPLFELAYENRFALYSMELQHLWRTERHAWVAGVRGQLGELTPEARLSRPLTGDVTDQAMDEPLRRVNAYLYDTWRLADALRLVGGIRYDRLTHPLNSEVAPLTEGTETRDQVAPRVGLVATPWREGQWRVGYSQSMGGQYFDNSVRLEPAQVAGFPQAFRSLVPESVGGLVPGTEFEAVQAAFDQRLGHSIHFGIDGGWLRSEGDREVGVLTNTLPLPIPDAASSTRQELRYEELGGGGYVVVSVGEGFSVGARYRISESTYDTVFPEVPRGASGLAALEEQLRSVMQQATVSLTYAHASGFLAQWETAWYRQENRGASAGGGGDEFWQHNVWVGYRWPQRRVEMRVGILNLTDQDPRLNPVSDVARLPRERMVVLSLRLNF